MDLTRDTICIAIMFIIYLLLLEHLRGDQFAL